MDIIFPIVSVVSRCCRILDLIISVFIFSRYSVDIIYTRYIDDAPAAPGVRDPGADSAGAPAPLSHPPRHLLHLAAPQMIEDHHT